MSDGLKQKPEKKAEQPQEAALYTIKDAVERRGTVIRIMKVMDEHPSISNRTRLAVNEICRELLKTVDELSKEQTRDESTRLQNEFTDLMKDLRSVVTIAQEEMQKAAQENAAPAPEPQKPAPKAKMPAPAPKPIAEAPKPAPKPAPAIKPAPSREIGLKEGAIEFYTRDLVSICRVMNRAEKWSVLFNEDGSTEVRTERGSAVFRGGKVEGLLSEAIARSIRSEALALCALMAQKVLLRMKQKQEEAAASGIRETDWQ